MYQTAEEIFQHKKELKKRGEKDEGDDIARQYKQQDEQMKKKIYQDHLAEMFSGVSYKNDPSKSQYQENYEFNKDFQKECDTQDFTHHMRKNDLKWCVNPFLK